MKHKILVFATLLSVIFFIGCNNDSATTDTITADESVINAEIDAAVDDVVLISEDQFDLQKSIWFYPQLCGYKFNPPLKNKIALLKFSNFL